MSDPTRRVISRRAVLGGAGAGVALAALGTGWYELSADSPRRLTLADWIGTRGDRYVIGHRGSGDVRPEHSMQAYEAAYRWGAGSLEISASSTADGVLICMHDLTFDRTTNATGLIHDTPSSELHRIGIRVPQLGPAWARQPLPKVPLLDDVLARFGGRVILCVEPKRDEDYPAVVALIEKHGLHDSVIIKVFHTSLNLAKAKQAGYPVFAYVGSQDVSERAITELAEKLNAKTDYLVIPTTRNAQDEYLPRSLVHAAVNTRVPVWVYPVHRRSEADHYFALGVAGVVSSSVGYSRRAVSTVQSDSWAGGAIAVGELTRDPADPSYALKWNGGVLSLAADKPQHFFTPGQFAPIRRATGHYRIEFEARWDSLPADLDSALSLAFGHADDRYYEQSLGNDSGYHGNLRANGSLELSRHLADSREALPIGRTERTAAAIAGQWMSLRLDVTPKTLQWSRLDGGSRTQVSVVNGDFRGGYFHLGRTSPDASLSLRRLKAG